MIFRPVLVTAPAESPVTLQEVKAQATVGFPDDDMLLVSMMNSAVSYLDGFRGVLGRAIVDQTWRISFDGWCRDMRLSVPDVSAVTVSYYDESGAEQTVSPAYVRFVEVPSGTAVLLSSDFTFPNLESNRIDPVKVEFTCGFGGASSVPENLKRAICAIAANGYDDRSAALPAGIEALIRQYRWTQA